MNHILVQSDRIILVYFLALNSFYALLLVLAIPEIWEQTRLAEDDDFQRLMQSDALPPVTLLVPAYNESATIEHSVTAMLTLEVPQLRDRGRERRVEGRHDRPPPHGVRPV